MATDLQVDQDIEELLKGIQEKAPRYKLVILNDNQHYMTEIVQQLIKALGCSPLKAVHIMMEAHHTGSAVALVGTKEQCTRALRILREIDLGALIEEEV